MPLKSFRKPRESIDDARLILRQLLADRGHGRKTVVQNAVQKSARRRFTDFSHQHVEPRPAFARGETPDEPHRPVPYD